LLIFLPEERFVMPNKKSNINRHSSRFWTPVTAVASILPTILTYRVLFSNHGSDNSEGCNYASAFPKIIRPLYYAVATIALLATFPISGLFLALTLPISLVADAIIGLKSLISNNDKGYEPAKAAII